MINKYIFNKIMFLLMLLIFFSIAAAQNVNPSKAIVGIYAELGNGTYKQGTAFFYKNIKQLVTSYHVIKDAKHVFIIEQGREKYSNVTIEKIIPNYDLAVLTVQDRHPMETSYLSSYNDNLEFSNNNIKITGHPWGIINQTVEGKFSNENIFMRSKLIKNKDFMKIIKNDLNLITLDITIFSGMSGAPVMKDDKVISIVSGSITEGRTIAWSIPIDYLNSTGYKSNSNLFSQITNWPELYTENYFENYLVQNLQKDTDGYNLLNNITHGITRFDNFYSELNQYSRDIKDNTSNTLRILTEKIVTDQTLTLDHLTDIAVLVDNVYESINPYREFHTNKLSAINTLSNTIPKLRKKVLNKLKYSEFNSQEPTINRIIEKALDQPLLDKEITDRVFIGLLEGRAEIVMAIDHLEHLKEIIVQQNTNKISEQTDHEIREILKIAHSGVGMINEALILSLSSEFKQLKTQNQQLLRGLRQVSEIILFERL